MNHPLWRCLPSLFSCALRGKRDAAGAAGRPLHGGLGLGRAHCMGRMVP